MNLQIVNGHSRATTVAAILRALAGASEFDTLFPEYFVYDDGRETHFALGASRELVVAASATEPDPVRTAAEWARGLDMHEFAFGYLTYEALQRPTAATLALGTLPFVHLVVPRTHLRVGKGVVRVDGVPLPGALHAKLDGLLGRTSEEVESLEQPALDRAVYLDGEDAYQHHVRTAMSRIQEGSLDKVVLSRRVHLDADVDFLRTFVAGYLRSIWYRSFLFQTRHVSATGFSPEILLTAGGDGTISTNPLAGTRRCGRGELDDQRMRSELLRDPKEIKEHVVSVLAVQGEFARVCARETISVTSFMSVREYSTVQHLSSRINGRLSPGETLWSALTAIGPGVTVTGLPKEDALGCIHHLEARPRGVYAGAVGYVTGDGRADLALPIRTVFRDQEGTYLQAGAGIMAESTPHLEFVETCNKLRAVGEYLRSTPPSAAQDE